MRFSWQFSKTEKILLSLFTALFFISGTGIIRAFYVENTQLQPAQGGEFTEGMVGNISPDYMFNPLFADGIESDISNLVFSGLMRFDPESGQIKDHIATHTLSPDKRVYDFTLHDNVMWHDGQPVKVDDILFTFRDVIQHPDFPVQFLKNAFQDVIIERVDDRTVRFTIPEKRKTFFTNFTIGLLPRHQLNNTPIAQIINHSFNQEPIGCGPYRFEGVIRDADFTQVKFSAFPDYFSGRPNIDTVNFFVFPTIDKLVTHVSKLDAIRPMQTRETAIIPSNPRFEEVQVISPRYLALFFNMKNDTLTTKKIRQAMRAAVDTTAMAEKYAGTRVDTPLVELWPQDDIVNISPERAQQLMKESGFLFASERNPSAEEVPTQEQAQPQPEADQPPAPEPTEAELRPAAGDQPPAVNPAPAEEGVINPKITPARFIYEPSGTLWQATGENDFFLVGSFPIGTASVTVNGYRLQLFSPESERFSYHAATSLRTLSEGENSYTVRFFNSSGNEIDQETVTIVLESDPARLAELQAETGIPNGPIAPEDVAPETSVVEEPEQPEQTEVPPEEPEEVEEPVVETDSAEEIGEGEETNEGESEEVDEGEEGNETVAPPEEENPEEDAGEQTEVPELELPEPEPRDVEMPTPPTVEYRENNQGYHVKLTLSYLSSFEYLDEIATDLQKAWEQIGVEIIPRPLSADEFRETIRNRDYELILLPQHIGYNLDAYPYFHLSQVGESGFNISNWKNLEASVLLEEIRATHDPKERLDSLARLRDIIIDDVPAIFLFTPKYSWLFDQKVKNVHINHLAILPDRFARIDEFYVREKRQFSNETSKTDFFGWFLEKSRNLFSFS